MGRKEQATARNESQDYYKTQMGYTAADRAQMEQSRGEVTGLARGLTTSEGYSPEEQAALQAETTGVASSAFGKARDYLQRRSAATHNTAGFAGSMAELGREEAQQQASTARQNRLAIANEKQRRQEEGINLMAKLYGQDASTYGGGRTAALGGLENYTNLANQKGAWDKLQNAAFSWLSPAGLSAVKPYGI